MEEVGTGARSPASDWSKEEHIREHRSQEGAEWPQLKKYSQWPSDARNKGKMGDPVFDYFAKTELQIAAVPEKVTVDAIVQLLDDIGQPVILLFHSGIAATGWLVADAGRNWSEASLPRSRLPRPLKTRSAGPQVQAACGV